ADLRRAGARGRLVAAHADDPCVDAGEGLLQRCDLAERAAAIGLALPQLVAEFGGLLFERDAGGGLDLDPPALLHRSPRRVCLGEEHAGVEREYARAWLDLQQQVDQHRLLLLEGGREHEPRVEALDHPGDDLLGGQRLGAVGELLVDGRARAHGRLKIAKPERVYAFSRDPPAPSSIGSAAMSANGSAPAARSAAVSAPSA